jgi:hypothetical protein
MANIVLACGMLDVQCHWKRNGDEYRGNSIWYNVSKYTYRHIHQPESMYEMDGTSQKG